MHLQQPNAPPIDLEQLHARCMKRADLVERVLACFQRQFSQDIEELQQLADGGNIAKVARVAHRMKGAAASSAAMRLREHCDAIETLAEAGADEFGELEQLLLTLREEWNLVCRSLGSDDEPLAAHAAGEVCES